MVVKILEDYIPTRYLPFLNNIGIKGLRITYSNKEVILSVRRFILKYLINLDRVLADLKRVGYTILGEKS